MMYKNSLEIFTLDDIKQTKSINVHNKIIKEINKIKEKFNNIFFNNFSAEYIKSSLFAEYRNKRSHSYGFICSSSVEFLIFLYDHLQDKENISSLIFPAMKSFLIKKEKEKPHIEKKELRLKTSIKVYPYLTSKIKRIRKDLNSKLLVLFGEEIYDKCLYRDGYRKFQKPFDYCLTIEFLICVVNDLLINEDDINLFIIPMMKDFIDLINNIMIKE